MLKKIWLVVVLFCMALAGCASAPQRQVAYSVYPIGYLLQRIVGNVFPYVSVQEEQTVVQRAQLKADYEDVLQSSDLFIHVGEAEPYLATNGQKMRSLCASELDLSANNAIYDFNRYTLTTAKDGTSAFAESPYYDGEVFDYVDTNTKDLYLWTDPIAMLSMSKDICSSLSSLYPDSASVFSANLSELEADLINLDAQYQSLATDLTKNDQMIRFATVTASFGSWQKAYGFEIYPLVLSKYGALPTDSQLEIIKKRIQDDNVKYIAFEPNMTEDMEQLANAVASELGLTKVTLSNVSSLTAAQEDAGKDYLSIMYENLATLNTIKQTRTETGGSDAEKTDVD